MLKTNNFYYFKQLINFEITLLVLLISIFISLPVYSDNIIAPGIKDIVIQEKSIIISTKDVEMLLQDMTPEQRERTLSSKKKLRGLLLDLLTQRKITSEAEKTSLPLNEFTKWKLQNNKEQILNNLYINKFKSNIVPPESIKLLAEEYYDNHPDEFTIPEQVEVSHILIKNESTISPCNCANEEIDNKNNPALKSKPLLKAEKIFNEISNGLDFSKAAKKYSDDNNNNKDGGNLKFIKRGTMVQEFEDAAFSIHKDGEILPPIKTSFGYHIIKRTGHKNESIIPYQNVKKQLIKKESDKYIASKSKEFKSSFDYNYDNINISPTNFNHIFTRRNQQEIPK